MAVCIEEIPEQGGCQVLVAMNKKMPTSGNNDTSGDEILNKVQRGFQQIFGRLREISPGEAHLRESRVAIEETVFNDIVALCHWRILSRLRSRKSKASLKSQKRFIGLHLQDFIEVPWHNLVERGDPQMTIDQLRKYRQYSKTLLESLDDLEAADVVRHEDLSRLKTVGSSKDAFSDNVQAILQTAKVHAEIQLLAHYEDAEDGVIRPRMIAATKDACSLCHSFIRLHGKFELPRTHGKLYGNWRLPAIYQNGPLQRTLNSYLEQQISTTLRRLIPLSRRPLMMFLNESNIYTINISASTLAAPSSLIVLNELKDTVAAPTSPSQEDATGSRADQPTSKIDHTIPSEECRNDNAADGVSGQRKQTDETITTESGSEDNYNAGAEVFGPQGVADAQPYASKSTSDASQGDDTGDASDSTMASDPRSLPEQILKPGQTITLEALSASKNRFQTNQIHISIDDSSSRFSLRWLSEAEAEASLRANTDAVLDVESIPSGVDVTLTKDAEGNTYFAYGREVVMIRALMTHDSSS
ncbi:hypothetical protein VPNG_07663 [Cytospora leucostoma]|uniref:Uncharacterized protein n=1 Tax=Cytospora leucostoma TaxID=1230097 RepID=A0A423WF83_9PEZI|nr:hypothetical protein VPNG_07663 [Cytospora leucostoma]